MEKTHKGSEANTIEAVSIQQLWSRYIVYWPLFLSLLFISVGAAWLYLRYTVPMYQANAKILIKDEKKGAEDSKAIESLNLLSTKKIIENEIEVIQSTTLIDEVIRDLYLYAPMFEEGKMRAASAYLTSPIRIEMNDPNAVSKSEKIVFTLDSGNTKVNINGAQYAMDVWVSTPYGILKFLPNPRYNGSQASNLYFTLVDPKKVAVDLQQRLEVASPSKLSTILNLSLKDEVPARGEDILNQLLARYSRAIVNDKNILAANTLAFVEERLNYVKKDLDATEQKSQVYKSNNGAMDISTQGRLFLENVSSNDQKLSEINMRLAVLKQVEAYVRTNDKTGQIVPSTLGVNDPALSQLLTELSTAETQYLKLKKTTAENYPSMVSIADQINKIKPDILENLQSQQASLEASRGNLSATNNQYSSMLQSMPQKQRELVEINREQSTKNEIYGFLLKKREETALSHASTVSDSRVVDKAQSSVLPVSPKKKVIYLAALTFAFLISIGSITAKETLNGKILFRSEIEKLTEYPIIGEIVQEKSKDPMVIGEGKRTFIAEQFRQLRIAIKFLKVNSRKKKIMVTSTIAGEGKSFIATNLALSFALTGKKVVLLELDLNRPTLSTKLNMVNDHGISDYLLGTREPEEIIKRTKAHENLFMITSGPLPDSPSELLMNGKIQDLLDYLEGIFDYVIVDIAPVGPVTDAYIVSSFCDVTLYVIRHKYTPKLFVQRLNENTKNNQLKNVAIVFNGILPRGFGKNKYGYGYGYGHVYNQNGYHSQKNA